MATTIAPQTINGTVTSWIPLTTPGPASLAECSSAIYYLPGAVSELVAFDPYYGRWIDTKVTCLATQQSQWWQQHSDSSTNDINLGPFACPTGYTTASVSEIDERSSFVGCCPSSYTFQGSFLSAATLGQCLSPLSVGQTIVGKSTVSASGDWEDTTAVVSSTGASVVAVHVNGYIFNDVTSPASVAASTTPGSLTSAMSTTAATSTALISNISHNNSTEASPNGGLSKGAKVGIGVGAALVTIIIISLIAALLMMKRRIRAQKSPRGDEDFSTLELSPAKDQRAKTGTSIYEAPGNEIPLDSKQPVEMWVSPTQGG